MLFMQYLKFQQLVRTDHVYLQREATGIDVKVQPNLTIAKL